jgi:hypothetical protein
MAQSSVDSDSGSAAVTSELSGLANSPEVLIADSLQLMESATVKEDISAPPKSWSEDPTASEVANASSLHQEQEFETFNTATPLSQCICKQTLIEDVIPSIFPLDIPKREGTASPKAEAESRSNILKDIASYEVHSALRPEYGSGHIVDLSEKSVRMMVIDFSNGEVSREHLKKCFFPVSVLGDKIIITCDPSFRTEKHLLKRIEDYFSAPIEPPPPAVRPADSDYSSSRPFLEKNHDIQGSIYDPSLPTPRTYSGISQQFYYQGPVEQFSEEWISRHVKREVTKGKGYDLYRYGHVLKFVKESDHYSTVVRGSTGIIYHCDFKLRNSTGRIEYWHCDCPAFESYEKACKHLVASFYAAVDYHNTGGHANISPFSEPFKSKPAQKPSASQSASVEKARESDVYSGDYFEYHHQDYF